MIHLAAGDARVDVDPAHGGRLARLSIGGRELLVGPPEGAGHGAPEARSSASIAWGAFLMAPWPGRLAGGLLRWRGREHRLARTHGRHAIHGLVHSVPWRVDADDDRSVRLSCDLGELGWPFDGSIQQEITLAADALRASATIHADEAMPAALGWHPWFRRRAADPRVSVDAEGTLELDAMIPTGRVLPLARTTDLRAGPTLGRRRLDDVYVDARSPAVISWPDLELRLEFTPPVTTIVVYTPPDAFCVEPQTAWPNALATWDSDAVDPDAPGAAAALEPGDELTAAMTYRWRQPGTSG